MRRQNYAKDQNYANTSPIMIKDHSPYKKKNENICSASGTPKSPYHALTMTYLNNANHDVLPTDKPVGRTTYLALIIS